jgi:hypothetical protein
MKLIPLTLIPLTCLLLIPSTPSLQAGIEVRGHAPKTPPLHDARSLEREMEERRAAADRKRTEDVKRAELMAGIARHPFRFIHGQTNSVIADGWMRFSGKVLQVHPDGVRIKGFFEPIKGTNITTFEGEFFVRRFPYDVADDSQVLWNECLLAKESGTHKYDTALGSVRTLRCLDYGTPITITNLPAARR